MGLSGHHTLPETADHLLSSFFTGCEKEFGFLERKHGFSSISGLTQYHKGRRIFTPFRAPSIVKLPFEAVTLFEKDDTAFEINYGGEHYALGLYVYYGRVHRFLLREVFQAARKHVKLEAPHAFTSAALEKSLHEAGIAVRKNAKLIAAPNPKLIERTLTIHDKLLEEGVRAQYRRDMEDAATQASKAFTAKDWPRVVQLLAPYEGYLNAATTKKLLLARKNLLAL